MLNRLTVALKKDLEADMTALLTPIYSKKLESVKKIRKIISIKEQFLI